MTSNDPTSILVVHRPGAFRDALVASLEKTEYVVGVAESASSGLEAFEQRAWSAVLAQESLAPRTGSWMLEWMKVLRPDTVTLLLATKTDVVDDRKSDEVVRLPVPPPAVVSRLARTLRDHGCAARQPTPTPTAQAREAFWAATELAGLGRTNKG